MQNQLLSKQNLSQKIYSLKHKINSLLVQKYDRQSKRNSAEVESTVLDAVTLNYNFEQQSTFKFAQPTFIVAQKSICLFQHFPILI